MTEYYNEKRELVAYRFAGGEDRGTVLKVIVELYRWLYYTTVFDCAGNEIPKSEVEDSANEIWVKYK